LRAGVGGTLLVDEVTLAGGILEGNADGYLVVGTTTTGEKMNDLLVKTGGTISGFGVIVGANLVDNGIITASGGTLTLMRAVSGSGKLFIDSGATLVAEKSLGVAVMKFETGGDATLTLDEPASMTSTVSGFGLGDMIDLTGVAATSLGFAEGTLTLYNGTAVVDTIAFHGSYSTANFTLQSNTQGSDIGYVHI